MCRIRLDLSNPTTRCALLRTALLRHRHDSSASPCIGCAHVRTSSILSSTRALMRTWCAANRFSPRLPRDQVG
jgi:hypothetical protein